MNEFCPHLVLTDYDSDISTNIATNPTPASLTMPQSSDFSFPKDENALLVMTSSGSTGIPKNIVLSEENLISVISSHLNELQYKNEAMLSILPLHHSFGLVIDFLVHLFAGSTIVRDPNSGRDIDNVIALMNQFNITSLSMVPYTLEKIFRANALHTLQRLNSGIIGGAQVPAKFFPFLRKTRLRVGYGQTEAGPGICLGAPGRFEPNYIGSAVGCRVNIGIGSELIYSGKNQNYGIFKNGIGVNNSEFNQSGDIALQCENDFFFLGRIRGTVKATNGKFYPAFQKAVVS